MGRQEERRGGGDQKGALKRVKRDQSGREVGKSSGVAELLEEKCEK